MLTIQLDDDSEQTLNKLAKQEHLQPKQLIKKRNYSPLQAVCRSSTALAVE